MTGAAKVATPGPTPGPDLAAPVRVPPPGVRTAPAVTAGRGDPSRGEEPRRVPAGGTARRVGVTWERVDAEDGATRPYPSVDRPGPPRFLVLPARTVAPPHPVAGGGRRARR